MVSIFEISGAAGLILIIAGVLFKKRKMEDILYIAGGILLAVYNKLSFSQL